MPSRTKAPGGSGPLDPVCRDAVAGQALGRRLALGAALLALAFTIPSATGQPQGAGSGAASDRAPSTLKVAYLYNFAIYTQWPALSPVFEVCVAGEDTLGDSLATLAAKEIAGRPVRVQALSGASVPPSCNLLFVAPMDRAQLDRLLGAVASRQILTVADIDTPADDRFVLTLLQEQGRMGFNANHTAAKARGLALSAKLLRLARNVY